MVRHLRSRPVPGGHLMAALVLLLAILLAPLTGSTVYEDGTLVTASGAAICLPLQICNS